MACNVVISFHGSAFTSVDSSIDKMISDNMDKNFPKVMALNPILGQDNIPDRLITDKRIDGLRQLSGYLETLALQLEHRQRTHRKALFETLEGSS